MLLNYLAASSNKLPHVVSDDTTHPLFPVLIWHIASVFIFIKPFGDLHHNLFLPFCWIICLSNSYLARIQSNSILLDLDWTPKLETLIRFQTQLLRLCHRFQHTIPTIPILSFVLLRNTRLRMVMMLSLLAGCMTSARPARNPTYFAKTHSNITCISFSTFGWHHGQLVLTFTDFILKTSTIGRTPLHKCHKKF